jgi:uncharacterized protein YbcI
MTGTDTPLLAGSRAAAISNMVVRLMSQSTGRGPTKARTYLNDDVVTVILQDTLTKAERTLVANDHRQLVLRTRLVLQDAMRVDLIAGVQEILGREVVAFLGANNVDPDVAVVTFLFAPAAEMRRDADM